ncbi:unnamed protein product, partial [Discosporangium mesarthrocarpum]
RAKKSPRGSPGGPSNDGTPDHRDGGDKGGGLLDDGPPRFLEGREEGLLLGVARGAREALVLLAGDMVFRLFHPSWQPRHGAALGVLSMLRAWNSRRRRGLSVPYGDRLGEWAEDTVARCLWVLALDRFADFSGRMVAPVRETAAQLLAVAALQLTHAKLIHTARLLQALTREGDWQARHGGLCGLQCLCAVVFHTGEVVASPGAEAELRALVLGTASLALGDPEEDVCAVAARTLRLLRPPRTCGSRGLGGMRG